MTEIELLGEHRVIRAANTVGGGLAERLRGDGEGAFGVVETEVGVMVRRERRCAG